ERLGIATIDPDTGTARDVRLLDGPGAGPSCPHWSPDGNFLVYEKVSAGSWDIWVSTAEGRGARRLTADPANERTATWSSESRYGCFIRAERSIWRLPMGAAARPTGPAQLWADLPGTKIAWDSLALSKDRAVVAITEEASDLWLVEFPTGE